MNWHDVVDIPPRGGSAIGEFAPSGLYVRVLSDFDEAPVGVVSLSLPARDHAAVLEKHLRDTGVTETVSSVLLHEVHRSGELARVFYTAVPVAARLRRERWAQRGQHLFVFPVAVLLARVLTASKGPGAAVLIKGGAALVIVADSGSVRVAEWFALSGGFEEDARRLADIVRRDLVAEIEAPGPHSDAVALSLFYVSDDTSPDGVTQRTARVLADMLQGMAVLEALGEIRASVAPAEALLAHARLGDAVQPRLDRIACYAERAVPVVAAAMMTLLLAGFLGLINSSNALEEQREAFAEIQRRLGGGDQAEIARLSALELERMNGTTRLHELLALREKAERLPDLRRVLQDIKMSLPENVRVTEVGIAAGDDATVIFVSGTMQWSGQVLSDEHRMVTALEEKGYLIKQRDFFSASAASGFRLALSWGLK